MVGRTDRSGVYSYYSFVIGYTLNHAFAFQHPALKKARFALAEYQRLKSRRDRDKMTIKALKEKERMTSAEQDKTQAIEQSLLTQIGELEKYDPLPSSKPHIDLSGN